jgi:hypothetical protein
MDSVNSFRGKILVIRGGAIGDFILTLPAITALRQQFPEAHLEVLGYPHIIQLALTSGLVDRIQSIEARALAGFRAKAASNRLADYFSSSTDRFLPMTRRDFRTNVRRCTAAQFIAGPHRPKKTAVMRPKYIYDLWAPGHLRCRPCPRLSFLGIQHPALVAPTCRADLPRRSPTQAGVRRRRESDEGGSNPDRVTSRQRQREEELAGAQMGGSTHYFIHSTELNLFLVGGEAEGERLQRLRRPCHRRGRASRKVYPSPRLRECCNNAWRLSDTIRVSRTLPLRWVCPGWFCGVIRSRKFGGHRANECAWFAIQEVWPGYRWRKSWKNCGG